LDGIPGACWTTSTCGVGWGTPSVTAVLICDGASGMARGTLPAFTIVVPASVGVGMSWTSSIWGVDGLLLDTAGMPAPIKPEFKLLNTFRRSSLLGLLKTGGMPIFRKPGPRLVNPKSNVWQ